MLTEHRESLNRTSELLLKYETIEADQFVALLEGKTEEEVFGTEAAAAAPGEGDGGSEAPVSPERPAPRPLPRPGLATDS